MDLNTKNLIRQNFLLLPPGLTYQQFLENCYQLLGEFGINAIEYPFSLSEFMKSEWNEYQISGKVTLSGVNQLLMIIETVIQSKINLLMYFKHLYSQIVAYDENNFKLSIEEFSRGLLNQINYLESEDKDTLYLKHFNLQYEDNFIIISTHKTLSDHYKNITQIEPEDISCYILYLNELLQDFEDLFNYSQLPEIKILLRSYFCSDLYQKNVRKLRFCSVNQTRKDSAPFKVNIQNLELFSQVVNSETLNCAVESFINDTLARGNSPFNNKQEGFQMIHKAFKWICTDGKVFYFSLPEAHGFSNQGFIFINITYCHRSDLSSACRLLVLLHECFHIYKRLDPDIMGKDSPENSFVLLGEEKPRAEDGHRFNNFLIPVYNNEIFESTAKFIVNPSNWNTSLDIFHEKFEKLQQKGKLENENSIRLWSSVNSIKLPLICFRFSLFS